jgi:hypothetical protein
MLELCGTKRLEDQEVTVLFPLGINRCWFSVTSIWFVVSKKNLNLCFVHFCYFCWNRFISSVGCTECHNWLKWYAPHKISCSSVWHRYNIWKKRKYGDTFLKKNLFDRKCRIADYLVSKLANWTSLCVWLAHAWPDCSPTLHQSISNSPFFQSKLAFKDKEIQCYLAVNNMCTFMKGSSNISPWKLNPIHVFCA